MRLEMKLIKDLPNIYADNNNKIITDFVQKVPILLPDYDSYIIDMLGDVIHVYGMSRDIIDYKIDEFNNRIVSDLERTFQGLEVVVDLDGMEKRVILHSQPYRFAEETRDGLNRLSSWRGNGGFYVGTVRGWEPERKSETDGESRQSPESRSGSSNGESDGDEEPKTSPESRSGSTRGESSGGGESR